MVFAKAVNLAGDGKRSATADDRVGEAADVATMLTNDVQLTHERPFLSPTAPDPPIVCYVCRLCTKNSNGREFQTF